MAGYQAERVELWENSAVDDRIYDVRVPVPTNADEADSDDTRTDQDEDAIPAVSDGP